MNPVLLVLKNTHLNGEWWEKGGAGLWHLIKKQELVENKASRFALLSNEDAQAAISAASYLSENAAGGHAFIVHAWGDVNGKATILQYIEGLLG